MLYGRTSGVPTDAALQPPADQSLLDLENYCSELTLLECPLLRKVPENTPR